MTQFDTLAAAYEAFAALPFRRGLEAPTIFAALGDVRERRVLDFGCGPGTYARWLKERGAAEVVGVDISDGMITHARDWEARDPRGVTYHLGTLPDSLAGTFDLVLAVYVLPYATTTTELADMCNAMSRALRPGGRLVTLPVNPDFHPAPDHYAHYGFRLRGERPMHDGDPVTLEFCPPGHHSTITARYWSRTAVEDALHGAGFAAIAWSGPRVPAEEVARQPPGYWDNYLNDPHALVVQAVKT